MRRALTDWRARRRKVDVKPGPAWGGTEGRNLTMPWTEEQTQSVWNRGQEVENNDRGVWRKDECGAWMRRTHYGNRDSQYGWEIDHIHPKRGDNEGNLRPLQWRNRAAKRGGLGDVCAVTAEGARNVDHWG